jgi:hypothetical protein
VIDEGKTQGALTPPRAPTAPRARLGLSGKLLVLTVLFVMVAEVMIYVPAVANFRVNWLNDRLAAAHTAALVLDAAPSGMVPDSLARQILNSVGARAVAMKMGNQRRLLAASEVPSKIDHDIDMRDVTAWQAVSDAFGTLLMSRPAPDGRRLSRDRARRNAAAQRDAALLGHDSSGVAADLDHQRHTGVLCPALHVRAPVAPADRQHDVVPRRSGKSGPHHLGIGPHR